MKGLTKRQKSIYDFIEAFIEKEGYSPSYREILRHFEFSSLGTVHKHLSVLKRKGVLSAEPRCGRSIKTVEIAENSSAPPSSEVFVPFIGQLTANSGVETFPQIHTLSLPSFMIANPVTAYILRVRGDAWLDEQIADGDLIVIDAQREVGPNEVVMARINDSQMIIKRIFPEGHHFRLMGRAVGSKPLFLRADQVEIQGIVIGVIRLYM